MEPIPKMSQVFQNLKKKYLKSDILLIPEIPYEVQQPVYPKDKEPPV